MSHTKGPWEVGKSSCFVHDPTGAIVAYIENRPEAERAANAALVAAAPLMAEALENILGAVDGYHLSFETLERLQECRDVLAKAKGEST